MTGEQRGTSSSDATRLARLVSEALGMFIYVFLGCGTLAYARMLAAAQGRALSNADWLIVGLAHGFAFFLATMLAQRISGAHINPAVTIALATIERYPWSNVLRQLLAQFTGALLGAGAIVIVFGRPAAIVGHLGAPEFAAHSSLLQNMSIEALGTAVLMLTMMGVSRDKQAREGWGPFATGMSVAAMTFFMGPVTSAAINPARAFGPDLISMVFGAPVSWSGFIVADLTGPLIGALAAALLSIYLEHEPVRPPATESQEGRADS